MDLCVRPEERVKYLVSVFVSEFVELLSEAAVLLLKRGQPIEVLVPLDRHAVVPGQKEQNKNHISLAQVERQGELKNLSLECSHIHALLAKLGKVDEATQLLAEPLGIRPREVLARKVGHSTHLLCTPKCMACSGTPRHRGSCAV